jgi:signal transduction histidine kinase
MGPGIKSEIPFFRRRSLVTKYVREYVLKRDSQTWRAEMAGFSDLDLSRRFSANDQRLSNPAEPELVSILARMGKIDPRDELNCGACGYETCREHAIAIYKGLAENEMCLPYTIDRLNKTNMELAISNEQLATTQKALLHSEKLASMGQLAAGIAHEVNNPLGVVLLYSHLLREEYAAEPRLNNDLTLITEQAERCKKIVAGLLGFARQSKVILEPTDVRELIERSLLNFPDKGKIDVIVKHDLENPIAELDRDQIIQVLTNLISNAIAAMPDGGELEIYSSGTDENIRLQVADTGIGIPRENIGKIFDPFFTTKQIGEGTGLGLAVTYGIVKMHYGDITVESNADKSEGPTGTVFIVTLPRFGTADTV